MANGAAGCGLEFRNDGMMLCGFLTITKNETTQKDDFSCLKYNKNLTTQRTTNHPFRCDDCTKMRK